VAAPRPLFLTQFLPPPSLESCASLHPRRLCISTTAPRVVLPPHIPVSRLHIGILSNPLNNPWVRIPLIDARWQTFYTTDM
jgi:hypothetical protein